MKVEEFEIEQEINQAFKMDFDSEEKQKNIDSMLEERGKNYGEFVDHAALSQSFKETFKSGFSYSKMTDMQKESIEMILHKIARIANGDPNYIDSWEDIQGYAKMVTNELKRNLTDKF